MDKYVPKTRLENAHNLEYSDQDWTRVHPFPRGLYYCDIMASYPSEMCLREGNTHLPGMRYINLGTFGDKYFTDYTTNLRES